MPKTDKDYQVLLYYIKCDNEDDKRSLRPQVNAILGRLGYDSVDDFIRDTNTDPFGLDDDFNF